MGEKKRTSQRILVTLYNPHTKLEMDFHFWGGGHKPVNQNIE